MQTNEILSIRTFWVLNIPATFNIANVVKFSGNYLFQN
jgi:hypothetical protein